MRNNTKLVITMLVRELCELFTVRDSHSCLLALSVSSYDYYDSMKVIKQCLQSQVLLPNPGQLGVRMRLK